MIEHNPPFIAVLGQTGSGKSALAMELALSSKRGEIVICDSVQVYRGFDIGSAKPTIEDQKQVPHHLVDLLEPYESFGAASYQILARKAILDIHKRGNIPIVVGGTGLYYRALEGTLFHDLPQHELIRQQLQRRSPVNLWEDLQHRWPQKAKELHPNDLLRIRRALEIVYLEGQPPKLSPEESVSPWKAKELYIPHPPKDVLEERIRTRTKIMLEKGLVSEVEGLLAKGVSPTVKPMTSIGYQQVLDCLKGQTHWAELEERIVIATRQYAKRQRTWFREKEIYPVDSLRNSQYQDAKEKIF